MSMRPFLFEPLEILAEDIIDLGKLMHFICFIMSNALDIRNFLEPIEKEYLRHQFLKSNNINFKEFMCNWHSMNWNATILCSAWNNNQIFYIKQSREFYKPLNP